MNIDEKEELYQRVKDSAGIESVKKKAIEEQMELAEVLLKTVGLDAIAEVMWEFQYEAKLTTKYLQEYKKEMCDSIVTMEQVTGEIDLVKDIKTYIDHSLILLDKKCNSGNLLDGLGVATKIV